MEYVKSDLYYFPKYVISKVSGGLLGKLASGNAREAEMVSFSIKTHNGYLTIRSRNSGEHRTVKIWTQKEDAEFFGGRRLVGLLSGPDNESDYQAFGFIGDDDRIVLWKKHRESDFYLWLARFLNHPERFASKVEVNFDGRCRRCNRTLTTPGSVESGIGPVSPDLWPGMDVIVKGRPGVIAMPPVWIDYGPYKENPQWRVLVSYAIPSLPNWPRGYAQMADVVDVVVARFRQLDLFGDQDG